MPPVAGERRVVHCMGTVFSFDVRTPGVDSGVFDDISRWLHQVDATFSTYRRDSEISRLARGEVSLADCAPEVRTILDRCEDLSRVTQGYFSAYADGTLDPSGLVKGWAIERASDLLCAAGSTNHCVNGGGDVQCVGEAAVGVPWRVGIADPRKPGAVAAIVTGRTLAVATSGTAERGTHVLDPHTGAPVYALASVSVIGQCISQADAYATAAFAMGAGARIWLDGLPGYWGLGIEHDGTTWASSALGLTGAANRPGRLAVAR